MRQQIAFFFEEGFAIRRIKYLIINATAWRHRKWTKPSMPLRFPRNVISAHTYLACAYKTSEIMQYKQYKLGATMDRLLALLGAALLLLPAAVRAQLPNGACYTEDSTCELQNDNLVGYSVHLNKIPRDFC